VAVLTTPPGADGIIVVELATAEQSIQKKAVVYDGDGDAHYDTISAFIKSMRGSDPDAALYWLAKMIHAGEDPRFITRRIMICAAEDVGLADPMALVLAAAAHQTAEFVGWPEARIPIAEAAIYIATAHKRNICATPITPARNGWATDRVTNMPMRARDTSWRRIIWARPGAITNPARRGWKRRSRNGWNNGGRNLPKPEKGTNRESAGGQGGLPARTPRPMAAPVRRATRRRGGADLPAGGGTGFLEAGADRASLRAAAG
jgi:putative ATPase